MKSVLGAYLLRLDAHLAAIASLPDRMRLIAEERRRVDRLERALVEWAASACGGGRAPTRFTAFELSLLHGELSMRLEATRRGSKGGNGSASF